MATWAMGDIQGCYRSLLRLVERIAFHPDRDRIWLVGDLVNRGPASLEVLRWVYQHRSELVVVLGNHDLHLLAIDQGVAKPRRSDTLDAVLEAPDRRELLTWLGEQPLLHREGNHLMVHAGLDPGWTVAQAEKRARRAERWLRGDQGAAVLSRDPAATDDAEIAEARASIAVLTRIRTVAADRRPNWQYAGPPEEAPPGHLPWFAVPDRRSQEAIVVFGHWAALGRRIEPGIIALDSGCVWGNALSAVNLEDHAVVEQPCIDRG